MRDKQVFRFDHFVLDTGRMSLARDGAEVELRPKAFETLLELVRNSGRVVSKDTLVQAVWPNVFVNDDALSQCIRDIRKVLEDDERKFIRTIPRRGYMFVPPVTDVAMEPAKANAPLSRYWIAGMVGLIALLGFVTLLVWVQDRATPQDRVVRTSEPRLTIAVLPFRASAGSAADKLLGEGLAEDLIVALARFAELAVVARNSSFGDVVAAAELDEAGRLLDADLLLQGSLRRTGGALRLSLQLVEPSTGIRRWTDQFHAAVTEFAQLQDHMVGEIAAQLVESARESTLSRVQGQAPDSLEVYELTLRARGLWRRFTGEGTAEALHLTHQALAMDSSYAVAWELMAQILLQLYIQPYDVSYGRPEVLDRARQAAARAVELDPRYATAQATLGAILSRTGAYDESLRLLEAALRMNPNDVTALTSYADILARAGEHRLSLLAWSEVDRLDPLGPPLPLALKARSHVLLGEASAALSQARTCVAKAPRFQPCQVNHAISAQAGGMHEEARGAAARLLELNPNFAISKHLQLIPYRRAQDRDAINAYLQQAGLPL